MNDGYTGGTTAQARARFSYMGSGSDGPHSSIIEYYGNNKTYITTPKVSDLS
jgi:hypothetical protein